jgi:hypothetical protein
MNHPAIFVRSSIPELHTMNATDFQAYIDGVKSKMVVDLASHLKPKVEFREYQDPQFYGKVIEASVIAMSHQEFEANYGNMQQRRGTSDGTMAIMQNGHWKVLGVKPTPKPVQSVVKVELPPAKMSAVDYLKQKMRTS